MKPNTNRLQTLLSMVKNITTRPHRDDETPREPWELVTAKMEQLELQFDGGAVYRRQDAHGDGAMG